MTDLPAWTRTQTPHDELDPARGVARGVIWGAVLWAILLTLAFAGCAAAPRATTLTAHRFEAGWVIETDDLAVIRRACAWSKAQLDRVIGCYVPAQRALYCRPADAETCWHEFREHHVTKKIH